MIEIKIISPRTPEVRQLIAALDQYLQSLYPADSNHLDSAEDLDKPHVYFVGAYQNGELVGCGAVKQMAGGYGEIKRVYVRPEARGSGVARLIMKELESHLVSAGIKTVRLETGIYQPESLGLYENCGYIRTGPFGSYRPDPLSVFMEKQLSGHLRCPAP